jgi:uncharacterized protein (DUF427 family)
MKVTPDPTGPGQESVWSYPRPPVAEPCHRHIKIVHCGVTTADTRRSIRTLETLLVTGLVELSGRFRQASGQWI